MSRRFRFAIFTFAIVFIYAISMSLIGVVVYWDYHRPNRDQRPPPVLLISSITAFAAIAINQFFLILKQSRDTRDIEKEQNEFRSRLEALENRQDT